MNKTHETWLNKNNNRLDVYWIKPEQAVIFEMNSPKGVSLTKREMEEKGMKKMSYKLEQ